MGEAGRPLPHARARFAVGCLRFHVVAAEARRAGHGAVPAAEASCCDVVPARMVEVPQQQFGEPVCLHLPAHVLHCVVSDRLGCLDVMVGGRPRGERIEHLLTGRGAGFDDVSGCFGVEQLRERKVKSCAGARSRVHRRAEADAGRRAAMHRDDEQLLAARRICRIRMRRPREDAVVHENRGELARSHAHERVAGRRGGGLLKCQRALIVAARPPQRCPGRIEIPLP